MERPKQIEDDSTYNTRQSGRHSFPPPWPVTCNVEPSELYQKVLRRSQYPPILQPNSQSLAFPYKEQQYFRTPSECIGNNYSPRAQRLKINKLQQRQHTFCRSMAKARNPPTPHGRRKAIAPRKRTTSSQALVSHQAQCGQRILESRCSPPMSPEEQLSIMRRQEEERRAYQPEPNDRDLERYMHYISNEIPTSALPLQPAQQIVNIMRLLPPDPGDNNKHIQLLKDKLIEEVKQDYYFSLKKNVVDYILMDPSECQRLSISSIPKPFPRRVICPPVPWTRSYMEAHIWLNQHLFTVNPIMIMLQKVWMDSFSSLRFVKLKDLFSTTLPLLPSEFEEFIQRQCQATRNELLQMWLPHCVSLLVANKNLWNNEQVTQTGRQEFINCVGSHMSLHLRSLVEESVQDLLQFFMIHEEGNDFGWLFDDMKCIPSQVLLVKLQVVEAHIEFTPSINECWKVIERAFVEIIKSAENLPRVECYLFPDVKDLYLPSVRPHEEFFCNLVKTACKFFHRSTKGPINYPILYSKYNNLLDDTAKQDLLAFLNEKHPQEVLIKKIEDINHLWKEIVLLPIKVPLSMFCLHAGDLNDYLRVTVENLKDTIVMSEAEENRKLNKEICQKYEEITDTIRRTPGTTEELVSLNQYVKKSSDGTIPKLKEDVKAAACRLCFLLDYAILPSDDLQLNCKVFQWPDQILTELQESKANLLVMKNERQTGVQKRVFGFVQRLKDVEKRVEAFKVKQGLSMFEMKRNVRELSQITAILETAATELEDMNKELALLDLEQSQFPMLQTLIADKQPYEQLWNTVLNFCTMSEVWLDGPFLHLDAEKMSDELDSMSRTTHKLTKTFSNLLTPCRVAKWAESRINQFKEHMPVLTTFCNPALRDRHWEQISSVVGFDVKPDMNASLLNMLDHGLSKFSKELEDIGASASKEYSLEKAMEKMKEEWENLQLSFSSDRDTGTKIVSAVDEIQVLLDDHIIKTQTMRASPFIKPIEIECKEWEDKLLSMQDILDAMLRCQATWLYLKPIFSSEDIITQMPEEGRKFAIVDSYWRNIIDEAVKDTRVLVATDQANMLERLKESNDLLDDIQKGLNT